MTPKEALEHLRSRNWSVIQIAKHVGMHRANVYKAYNGEALPRHDKAVKIIELAKSGRKGPRKVA
jgi:DNA-binding phage protein